jgi:ATP-dependent Clp protease ATP-binding subunit ClpA
MAFERFTRDARAAVLAAREEARCNGQHAVESEHLLLALAARPEFGLDRDRVADALAHEEEQSLAAVGVAAGELEPDAGGRARREPQFATSSKLALQRAVAAAAKRGDRRLTAGHVLLGVLAAEHGRVPRALRIAEIDVDEIRARI